MLLVRWTTTSTRALHASYVEKARTLSLDRHRVRHARQAQLTLTATRPLRAMHAVLAAMAYLWSAYRALSALTTTMRIHRLCVSHAGSAHSHRKAPQRALRVLLASTTTIWTHLHLVTAMIPPALQGTTLVLVARAAILARLAQLTWTVMHPQRAMHVMLGRTRHWVR